MNGEMVVETPAKGLVTTSLVCLSCSLSMFGRDFEVFLVCLPLTGMDVIFGMNWLEYNCVHIYIVLARRCIFLLLKKRVEQNS